VLQIKALQLYSRGESVDAEYLYRRLLELEPNFVLAYGQLGYIAMMQTRFAEAEEYFTSYRFIAPDQANPHDSLGELYIIQGRYEEAETSFETAIQIKPNFWPSYTGLVRVRELRGDFRGAQEAIDRFAALEDAPEYEIDRLRCRIRFAEAVAGRLWNRVLEDEAETCPVESHAEDDSLTMVHLAACQVENWELAEAIEESVRRSLEEARSRGAATTFDRIWPRLLHLEGVRLAMLGELEEAEKRFRDADANLTFKGPDTGLLKLRNQTLLVETLMARSEDAAAHRLLAKIRTVNPAIVDDFEETGFGFLGLERS
jgi:tetratricopeptide (TPR) repeat protein